MMSPQLIRVQHEEASVEGMGDQLEVVDRDQPVIAGVQRKVAVLRMEETWGNEKHVKFG